MAMDFMDAFVANDTTRNFLFHNLGGKKFEEVGAYGGRGLWIERRGAVGDGIGFSRC